MNFNPKHLKLLNLCNPIAIFYDPNDFIRGGMMHYQTHYDRKMPSNPPIDKTFSISQKDYFQYIRDGIIIETKILDDKPGYGVFRFCQLKFKGLWTCYVLENK